jgi:iron(III) transport system permease protein
MDPAIEEVAASLGQSPWSIFRRCTLPLLRPVVSNGALLISSHMLVEFGALAFMRVQTFTTAIYEEFDLEFNGASGVTLAALLLVFCLLFLALESRVRKGAGRYARLGSGTRRAAGRVALGAYRWPASLAVAMLIGIGAGVPVLTLAYWLAVGHSQAAIGDLVDATRTTLYLGAIGAILTTLLGVALALAARANRGRIAGVAMRLPFFIHALPGLVIALALVFFALHYGHFLYQTTALLMLGYATLYVPLVQIAVGTPLEEVARSLGRRQASVFVHVVLPNISVGIGAGAALVFLQITKELTATIILLPTGVDTLSIEVWQHAGDMEYAAAAPFAILLMMISGLPVYLLMRRKHLVGAEQQML